MAVIPALISAEDMVRPKAIAPFEAQHAFARWVERFHETKPPPASSIDDPDWQLAMLQSADGFGPPFQLGETRLEFGLRAAAALFHFIKES